MKTADEAATAERVLDSPISLTEEVTGARPQHRDQAHSSRYWCPETAEMANPRLPPSMQPQDATWQIRMARGWSCRMRPNGPGLVFTAEPGPNPDSRFGEAIATGRLQTRRDLIDRRKPGRWGFSRLVCALCFLVGSKDGHLRRPRARVRDETVNIVRQTQALRASLSVGLNLPRRLALPGRRPHRSFSRR